MAIFIPPRITSAVRTGLVLNAGELVFDTNKGKYYVGNGTVTGGLSIPYSREFTYVALDYGYLRLPYMENATTPGNLVIEWGSGTIPADSNSAAVTPPLAMIGVYRCVSVIRTLPQAVMRTVGFYQYNVNSGKLEFISESPGGFTFDWICVGYAALA